jgi:hypothetical protein
MKTMNSNMEDYQQSPLWISAFSASIDDGLASQRTLLVTAYEEFRKRVSFLVAQIHKDMPSLTVHDITHLDKLWWTASEIAGPGYPLNPAEAFVLGGAFLLHDAAHSMAAYPGGINEIRELPEWKYFSAIAKVDPTAVTPGSEAFQLILFEVLRAMHPRQARRLPMLYWTKPGDSEQAYLLPNEDLRHGFGDAIGRIAESHWTAPHGLEELNHYRINPLSCLRPASWTVDILKLAILLRTADAAHIDSQRAPRFLMALVQPGGSSLVHWQFQSRIHEVKRDPDAARNDLCISGSAFPASEQDAWWMAYDASRMIDNELRAADRILLDLHRPRLAARSVAFSYSPEAFARNVPTDGWQPVDTSIKITDIKSMVERFGGEKLYGDDKAAALRELFQNSIDAIHACRKLGGLGADEGEIEVLIEDAPDGHWLTVTDTGIGMSRYVLTEVLLDFGRSLWRSPDLRGEWSGLPSTGFEAIGQFGIGFFSIFMLGEKVRIITRRYESKEGESEQWLLEFMAGTNKRPILRVPSANEKLRRHGTRISVFVSQQTLLALCPQKMAWFGELKRATLDQTCARLAPAIDINLFIRRSGAERNQIVKSNDWKSLSPLELLQRVSPATKFDDAIPDEFGVWSHLSDFKDSSGTTIGRGAVNSTSEYTYYNSTAGIGVVKGLYAGELSGVAGLVFASPQNDLARKTASPNITLEEVMRWANDQKDILLRAEAIGKKDSALLSRLGANFSGLILGDLGGQFLAYEDLVEIAKTSDIFFVHDGEVSHSDDDDVLQKDFSNYFQQDDALIELSTQTTPAWVSKLGDKSSRDTWSLERALASALEASWGEVNWDESEQLVGSVHGEKIIRTCKVATRNVKISADDL